MPTISLDAQGRLDADVPCIACGYNLRSTTLDGNCPECGTPVDRSARGDLLLFADQPWLDRVQFGLTLLLIIVLAGMVLGMILGTTAAVLNAGGPGNRQITLAMQTGLMLTLGVVSLIAWLKFTSPEPEPFNPEPAWNARRITRVGIILSFALGLISQVVLWLGISDLNQLNNQLFGLASQLCGIVQTIAGLLYARALALRIPNSKLAHHARILTWGMGAALAAVFAISLVSLAVFGAPAPPAATSPSTAPSTPTPAASLVVMGLVTGLLGMVVLVLGIWALLFANRLRMALRDVLRKTAAAQ